MSRGKDPFHLIPLIPSIFWVYLFFFLFFFFEKDIYYFSQTRDMWY